MGSVCCKPKQKEKQEPDPQTRVEGPMDRTQSIFVKSKVEKFKKQTNLIENNTEFERLNLKKPQEFIIDNISSDGSDIQANVKSVESSQLEFDHTNSRYSASHTSVVSRSISASAAQVENFQEMNEDSFKKGKILRETKIKTIYQCMHTNTGKLLISKTYKVRFSSHEIFIDVTNC